MSRTSRQAVVGLSGGVDSAVAAWLLQQAGWEVTTVTMSIWDESLPIPDRGLTGCFGPGEVRDLEAAREIARRLGVKHRVIRLAREYRQIVLDYVRQEYLAGQTPNPCARCNQRIKFDLLLEAARQQGLEFERFATGHYARVEWNEAAGRWQLRRGVDRQKDQSYFLARLDQRQLAGLMFPLGEHRKSEVKELARRLGWSELADRRESQDFIECEDYGVLFGAGEAPPGEIVTREGKVLGRHQGIYRYTVGQRKGLRLGGGGTPWYVLEVDAQLNRIVVGPREALAARELWAEDIQWVSWPGPREASFRCQVQIRQRHSAAPAEVRPAGSGLRVVFDVPQMAVTPGQMAVLYEEDMVLASGIIRRAPSG